MNKPSKFRRIVRIVRNKCKRPSNPSFNGKYDTWKEASEHATGYDSIKIFDKCAQSALKVANGEAVYERDSFLFYKNDYDMPLLCALYWPYLLDGYLHIVDFGGALGSQYFQEKDKLTPLVRDLSWYVVEQKRFVQFGRKNLEDNHLFFCNKISDVHQKINCVLFRSSLEYLDDADTTWEKYLDDVMGVRPRYIIVDRTSVSEEGEWYSIQKVHEPIYEAEYVVHIFDKEKLINYFAENGYKLEQEFKPDASQIIETDGYRAIEVSFVFRWV